jgi:AcrR family transcriptional regulator
MSETVSEARKSRRMEVRRAQILDAAAEVFIESGYEAATLDVIGERVGLSKPSLYYYVRGKEDLLAQILLDLLERVWERVDAAADAGPSERLRVLARSHVEILCTRPGGRLMGRHADIREQAAKLANTGGRYRRTITDIVADGVAAGQFRPVDLEIFGWTFMLALNSVASWWTPEHPRSPHEIADEIAGYFLAGMVHG